MMNIAVKWDPMRLLPLHFYMFKITALNMYGLYNQRKQQNYIHYAKKKK